MSRVKTPGEARIRRHRRVRQKVSGTAARPRLCVFRSLNHIYAQAIDDILGHTLTAASSLEPSLKEQTKGKPKSEEGKLVGKVIAQRLLEKGISQVVFDRGGFQYHGRVKSLAEGAREGGLRF